MAKEKWSDAMNTMMIEGQKATITYDEDLNMFRGEFVGLNGGADFYASDIEVLHKEGATSLHVFLDMCREDAVDATSAKALRGMLKGCDIGMDRIRDKSDRF
jgi:predicted HicB family RNase H-like nuclease